MTLGPPVIDLPLQAQADHVSQRIFLGRWDFDDFDLTHYHVSPNR